MIQHSDIFTLDFGNEKHNRLWEITKLDTCQNYVRAKIILTEGEFTLLQLKHLCIHDSSGHNWMKFEVVNPKCYIDVTEVYLKPPLYLSFIYRFEGLNPL